MDTTAVLSSPPNRDHPPDPTGDSPLCLVDPNPVDAANVLVEVHARVGRTFASYEAAEGSHARQYQSLGAISTALATHVAVEDELIFPAVRAQTGRHDAELERQRQQDHLLDLLLVERGAWCPAIGISTLSSRFSCRCSVSTSATARRWLCRSCFVDSTRASGSGSAGGAGADPTA